MVYSQRYLPFLSENSYALQAVLQSPVAKLFVSAYSIKMRGGYLRFQAQNIRRIRLPRWEEVAPALRERLINSVQAQNKDARDEAVFELYQLGSKERSVLLNNVES